MKGLFGYIIVLCLLVASLSLAVSAAANTTFNVGSATCSAGESVIIPVTIKNNKGLTGVSLTIEFDTSVLTLTNVSDAGLIPGECHTSVYTSPYELTWHNDNSVTNFTSNGVLVNLEFIVSDTAKCGTYDIVISSPTDGILDCTGNVLNCSYNDGSITIEDERECIHSWNDWEKTSSKQHKRSCKLCGEAEYERHNWDDGEVIDEPLPGKDGLMVYTCETCNATKSKVLDALPDEACEHEWGIWIAANNREHKRDCMLCGNVEYGTHHWGSGVVTVEPTETSAGKMTYTCSTCDITKYEDIPALEPEIGVTKFTMTSNKTEVLPGDEITVTLNMGPVQNMCGLGIKVVVPEGLTLKNGSARVGKQLTENHATIMAEFDESNLYFTFACDSSVGCYSCNTETILLSIVCTVDEAATGEQTVTADFEPADFFDKNFDSMKADTTGFKATVNVTSDIAEGATVSGTVVSYGNEADAVTVELWQEGKETASYSTTVNGNHAAFSIDAVADGSYTLKVMKKNHVTRAYSVIVSGNTTQDAKICLIGDVTGDGKITILDVNKANLCFKGKVALSDYEFLCADVNNSGTVTIMDVNLLNLHYKGKTKLW